MKIRCLLRSVMVAAACVLAASQAHAASGSWQLTGPGASGQWTTSANWSAAPYPGAGDTASITANNANTFTCILNTTLNVGSVNLWNLGTGQAWLTSGRRPG